ncbi:hypothetical protein KFU94_01270 [Chloroflexi bacterium TSY]|nr:hypothetical protein [Chloroflexi bacterium TSY]
MNNTQASKINDPPVPGQPYTRHPWKKSIGGERSSCVFALAETMIKVS